MNGHPHMEFVVKGGSMIKIDDDYVARHRRVDASYVTPRKIICEGYADFVESCSECPCFVARRKKCGLLERKLLSWEQTFITDINTIPRECPLPLYSYKST